MDDDLQREIEDMFNEEAYIQEPCDVIADEVLRFVLYRIRNNLTGGKKPRPD